MWLGVWVGARAGGAGVCVFPRLYDIPGTVRDPRETDARVGHGQLHAESTAVLCWQEKHRYPHTWQTHMTKLRVT